MRRYAWLCLCMCSAVPTAMAAPGESSFTPTSLRVPIHFVRLENAAGDHSAELYRCATEPRFGEPSTDDLDGGSASGDCMVDMADNAALAELFTHAVDVPLGHYDRIRVYLCSFDGSMGYESEVKGSIELDGTTYFTTRGADVLSDDPTDWDYTTVSYSGCAADVPLAQPLDLEDGDVINISAFFSLRNIAWATVTGNGPPSGCAFDAAHSQSVCSAYPIPIPFVGDVSPSLDTYYITENTSDLAASTAGGQLLLLRDAGGEPFGGFSRRLYSATSVQPSVNYDTPIKSIMPADEGDADAGAPAAAYVIETYGGGSPGGPPIGYYLHFPAFELANHDGIMLRADGMSLPYRAVKQ